MIPQSYVSVISEWSLVFFVHVQPGGLRLHFRGRTVAPGDFCGHYEQTLWIHSLISFSASFSRWVERLTQIFGIRTVVRAHSVRSAALCLVCSSMDDQDGNRSITDRHIPRCPEPTRGYFDPCREMQALGTDVIFVRTKSIEACTSRDSWGGGHVDEPMIWQ